MPRKTKSKSSAGAAGVVSSTAPPAPKRAKLDDNGDDNGDDMFGLKKGLNGRIALDLSDDDGGSSDGGSGGVELKINEEFAKRFEYNKKREELQRLEEKYKSKNGDDSDDLSSGSGDDDDDDDSISEEEDEFGELATADVDADIEATLKAIRSKDPKVYDPNVVFFKPAEEEEEGDGEGGKQKKEKPMYLRDYHRQNLLSGKYTTNRDDEEEQRPKTFLEEQDALKNELVRDMHAAAADSDSDSDFLTTKPSQTHEKFPEPPDPATADPANPEVYLSNFLASRAWLPKDRSQTYGPALESDDSSDDELAETFETAYNFRFEDPVNAPQILGHARQTLAQASVRRGEKSARKRAREEKRRRKEEEKKVREMEKGRLRALKIEQVMEKVRKIKEAAGLDTDIEEEDLKEWQKFLKGEWSDEQWEEEMQKRFNEEYYTKKEKEGGKVQKPTWDDDIDIADIVSDFTDSEADEDNDEASNDNPTIGPEDQPDVEEATPTTTPETRKALESAKRALKKSHRATIARVEKYVDDNFDFDTSTGATKKGFRYRSVSPETFGLTPLDILAAEDAQLNEYAGLKKLATFREKERKRKDKKRYKKKRVLAEWRKAVFGDEKGVVLPEVGPAGKKTELVVMDGVSDSGAGAMAAAGGEKGEEVKVDIVTGERKRKRKRK